MPIPLALVASGSSILVESHEQDAERFLSAASTILTRIPPNSSRLSYAFEDWLFHYVSEEGLVYLCVADGEGGRRLPFAFLSEVQKQFLAQASDASLSDPEDADFSAFQGSLTSLRRKFSDSPDSDPVKAAQAELGAVKDIMTQNVEQILSRGERIELLMDRTGEAANQSMAFRRRAKGLRRSMWWKNTKVTALAGFCVVVFILFLWSFLT
ncbi:unnamed protein product [Sympodiomycopsis kandeliae]